MHNNKDLSQLAIDAVLCLSVKARTDRRELLEQEFAGSGLAIEFLLVDRDGESPERGCFTSHVRCAELALQRGYERVLILEDDATLMPFRAAQVQQINRFLSDRDPELFYLGGNLGKVWLTWHRGVARVRTKGSHAYLLNRKGCERLLSHAPYAGVAIDRLLCKQYKAYMAFPMLCQQQSEQRAPSDILASRSQDGTCPDDTFWQANWRKQYTQAFRNMGKTLLRFDI